MNEETESELKPENKQDMELEDEVRQAAGEDQDEAAIEQEQHIPPEDASGGETYEPEEETAAPVDPLAALTDERDALQDQILRLRAEFDNYRKRMSREAARIRKTAAENVIRDLLPVVDNLERALDHVDDTSGNFAEGVGMVLKQLCDALASKGLEPIASVGEVFDPNVHEAISHVPSEDHAADTVMEELLRGYKLNGMVLRPAQVAVSSGPYHAKDLQTGENDEENQSDMREEAAPDADKEQQPTT